MTRSSDSPDRGHAPPQVVQDGRRLDLRGEKLSGVLVCYQLTAEVLHRHGVTRLDVKTQPDLGHASSAQRPTQPVTTRADDTVKHLSTP